MGHWESWDVNVEGQVCATVGIKKGGKLGSNSCNLSDSQSRDDKSLDQNNQQSVFLKSKSAETERPPEEELPGQGEPLKKGGS